MKIPMKSKKTKKKSAKCPASVDETQLHESLPRDPRGSFILTPRQVHEEDLRGHHGVVSAVAFNTQLVHRVTCEMADTSARHL